MNKKPLFLGLTIAFLSAAPVALCADIYEGVVIRFCRPKLLGCAPRAVIGGKELLVDPVTPKARLSYKKIAKETKSKGLFESRPVKVKGKAVKEKGHFPNPMAEFEVLKIINID